MQHENKISVKVVSPEKGQIVVTTTQANLSPTALLEPGIIPPDSTVSKEPGALTLPVPGIIPPDSPLSTGVALQPPPVPGIIPPDYMKVEGIIPPDGPDIGQEGKLLSSLNSSIFDKKVKGKRGGVPPEPPFKCGMI